MESSNKREASSPHGRQSSRSSDPNLASQEEGEIPSCPQRTRRSPSGNRVFVLLVRPTAPCPEALLSAMWGRAPLDTVVSVQICHPRPRWRGRHRGESCPAKSIVGVHSRHRASRTGHCGGCAASPSRHSPRSSTVRTCSTVARQRLFHCPSSRSCRHPWSRRDEPARPLPLRLRQ